MVHISPLMLASLATMTPSPRRATIDPTDEVKAVSENEQCFEVKIDTVETIQR